MKQEEKDLLIQDLCARLPYGVKCQYKHIQYVENGKIIDINMFGRVNIDGHIKDICDIKPYLFPLSSMTEEQKKESPFESSLLNAFINGYISLFEDEELAIGDVVRMLEWLNKNHFDYRGLIPMGLAIDCTNLNIY